LLTSLLVLVPTSYTRAFDLPFTVFALDFASLSGRLTVSASSKMLVPGKPRLASLVQGTQEASEQAKVDLISLTLKLLAQGAELHKSLPGFIEMYEPAVEILSSVRQKGLSPTLSVSYDGVN
jgi:nucleolar protein 14